MSSSHMTRSTNGVKKRFLESSIGLGGGGTTSSVDDEFSSSQMVNLFFFAFGLLGY